jgi:hypothetical protein
LHKQLPTASILDMSLSMTTEMANSGTVECRIVLQDHKRLPARFFAEISGAINSRAA